MNRILVVDDEQDLCEILQFNLENEGYKVDTANSAEEALKMLTPEHELILLDVMMAGMSGYQMARRLRTELHNEIPIIFLTAKNTENDMLTGFSIGGDDYIAKPFSIKEVIARIKAVTRRHANDAVKTDSISTPDGLVLDKQQKNLTVNGVEVELTKTEYLILQLLLDDHGKYYQRDEILKAVWPGDSFVLDRTVDVHIARLRKKLGALGNNIVNKQGFGYAWIGAINS